MGKHESPNQLALIDRAKKDEGIYGLLLKRGLDPSEYDMERAAADFHALKNGKDALSDDEIFDNLSLHILRPHEKSSREDFDWDGNDVVVREQRRIAVYKNYEGDIVIRGQQDFPKEDRDPYFVITLPNLDHFISALKALR